MGSRLLQSKSMVSLCNVGGNTANVDATVYGSESNKSFSRKGTRQPRTFSTASPSSIINKAIHVLVIFSI